MESTARARESVPSFFFARVAGSCRTSADEAVDHPQERTLITTTVFEYYMDEHCEFSATTKLPSSARRAKQRCITSKWQAPAHERFFSPSVAGVSPGAYGTTMPTWRTDCRSLGALSAGSLAVHSLPARGAVGEQVASSDLGVEVNPLWDRPRLIRGRRGRGLARLFPVSLRVLRLELPLRDCCCVAALCAVAVLAVCDTCRPAVQRCNSNSFQAFVPRPRNISFSG